MVERDLPKVDTGVRFPSPAPMTLKLLKWGFFCALTIHWQYKSIKIARVEFESFYI